MRARSTRRFWFLFGLLVAALIAVLVWMSDELLDRERGETWAQRLNTAKARIDGKLRRMLAPEERRPIAEYLAFYEVERDTYARRDMQKIAKGELLVPSPLLVKRADFIKIHYELGPDGLKSPQVPTGVFQERAEEQGLSQQRLAANRQALTEVKGLEALRKTLQSDRFEPHWIDGELHFARLVRGNVLQGFHADWPKLRSIAMKEIEGLFASVALVPATGRSDLLTIPVRIQAKLPRRWTASHTVVAFTWIVVLSAIVLAGLTFRRFIAYGEKQRGFASMVTHELRSPLTTFRLYSDLLAEGLVKDEEQAETYHKTLQRESDHMARLVENVIAHSRLEEGRVQLHRERTLLGDLLDKVTTDLRQLTERHDMTLTVDTDGVRDVALETDAAAVGQILRNLVENACKYGASEERPAIHVGASKHNGTLKLRVRDHGPGVPSAVVRRIFRPFERGGRDEADPVRGLGLGLTLSRGLARDLGGDLAYEAPADGGACFVLSLPVAV